MGRGRQEALGDPPALAELIHLGVLNQPPGGAVVVTAPEVILTLLEQVVSRGRALGWAV